MKNVIIDTDIGDDIDDVLALAYAVKSDECHVEAVTTVFKNAHVRAKIAAHYLQLAGFPEIPVYAGEGAPLLNVVDTETAPKQYLDVMKDAQYNTEMTAVDFLYKHYMESESPATLLTIGPLTNIAKLLQQYPEVASQIPEIYLMGGCFYTHMNEWNIECDPEAAQIVVQSGIPLKFIGLDVTTQCKLTDDYLSRVNLDDEENALLMAMMKEWFKQLDREGQTTPVLHDPLALHALLYGDVDFQTEVINVELDGTHTRGTTFTEPYRLWGGTPPASTNCQVGYKVNNKKVVEEFFNKVFG